MEASNQEVEWCLFTRCHARVPSRFVPRVFYWFLLLTISPSTNSLVYLVHNPTQHLIKIFSVECSYLDHVIFSQVRYIVHFSGRRLSRSLVSIYISLFLKFMGYIIFYCLVHPLSPRRDIRVSEFVTGAYHFIQSFQ